MGASDTEAYVERASLHTKPQRVLNDLSRTKLSCDRMIRLLAHPLPSLSSASCLSFSVFQFVAGRANWREGGGREAKSYDREKALPSINLQILSVCRL
jgi:hypothetical protein